jgi:hypothetical protein
MSLHWIFLAHYTSVYIKRETLIFGFPCIWSVYYISIDAHYSHIISYIFITLIILHSMPFDYAKNMSGEVIKRD